MKIMHFIGRLSTGGAETLVKEYALKLKNRKYNVVVLCLSHYNDSPYEKLLSDNGIKVIYACDHIRFSSRKNIFFKFFNNIQRYFFVKKIIHEENPNILHVHLELNRYVKFARPSSDVKLFYTVHSLPSVIWPNKFNKEFRATKWLVNKNNMRFICLHNGMKNEVNKMFDVDNSIVINNGIDFDRFEKRFDKRSIKNSLGIDNSYFVIGHIGRFSKVKNHEFLVNLFNQVYKNNNNAFLLMVGDGIEKESIVNKLHELKLKDRFMILSNRSDIPELLSVMDVFVFPSIYEGLGIALIEAQKMKLPCFISDTIPSHSIISNLVTKLSLNSDLEVWTDKIINYKKPKKIEINDEDWNMDMIIEKLEKIYLGKL
ncbi:MAG: glycosyltransferase [Bacilli bacterium]|nr:glycosyltransferase [Bacilli bacterium]